MNGEKFDNESLLGKSVLLQFWTTWCPYCKNDQEGVDTIAKEFEDQGLVVLAVDVAESKKKVEQYLKKYPRACRIVLTEDTNLAARFAAKAYPIYVLIDPQGKIADEKRGGIGEDGIRRMLRKVSLPRES